MTTDTDIIRQLRDALEASNTWLFGHHNEVGQGRRRFCNAELIAAADAHLSAAPAPLWPDVLSDNCEAWLKAARTFLNAANAFEAELNEAKRNAAPQASEPTRSQKLAAAGFTARPSLRASIKLAEMRQALELIAAPKRPDGTWNRDREACRELAAEALGRYDDEDVAQASEPAAPAEGEVAAYKPHNSHGAQMQPGIQQAIDAADKRARDKAAMPIGCSTPRDCRMHSCHGACLPCDTQPADLAPWAKVLVMRTAIAASKGEQ